MLQERKDLALEKFSRAGAEKYTQILQEMTAFKTSSYHFNDDVVSIGKTDEITPEQQQKILAAAKNLMPWKKGPYNLFGEGIDGEWRSDQKWNRILPHLPSLKDKAILDIGCNNGYFLFKMMAHAPALALGFDPVLPLMAQFYFLKSFLIGPPPVFFEPLGISEVALFEKCFDVIFSMGILYHHRDPIGQLLDIKKALRPGGVAIVESITIPGPTAHDDDYCLVPQERYAKMKNVFFVPTVASLKSLAHKAKFSSIEVISSQPLDSSEQRVTKWSSTHSLEDFLDPNNDSLTCEGYPAPWRTALKLQV